MGRKRPFPLYSSPDTEPLRAMGGLGSPRSQPTQEHCQEGALGGPSESRGQLLPNQGQGEAAPESPGTSLAEGGPCLKPPALLVGGAHPLTPAGGWTRPSRCTLPRTSQGSGHVGPSSWPPPSGRGSRGPESLARPPPQEHTTPGAAAGYCSPQVVSPELPLHTGAFLPSSSHQPKLQTVRDPV